MTTKTTDISNTKLDLVERVLANRKVQASGSSNTGILLHGDPGTGKTSLVRYLAHLFGVSLVLIEAPHITEEHIINIPFIVFKSESDDGVKGNTKVKASGPSIVLADSNLYTKLSAATKISDAELLRTIYSSKQIFVNTWEELGGSEKVIPDEIKKFRDNTKTILFLDEFFRQSSVRIRNVLRGILNGKLGMHDMPKDVYVIYASNLKDEGVEPMALNNDFESIEVETPNKEEWFKWLIDKFKDTEVVLDKKVLEVFHKLLKQEDLNSHDMDAEVRASPRTWEQIILYVNSSLPVKNDKDAASLISNIRAKFTNYKTEEEHKIAGKVIDAVSKLIKVTSNIDVSTTGNSASDWRETLEHQIAQKMKLGKYRTYIPIVSGPPGIGKTSQVVEIARDLNLRYIYIDCSTLDPEMVMGIPLSNEDDKKNISVEFSFPQLYKQIKDDISKADTSYSSKLTVEQKKVYKNQKFKYLIFFDELNRTSTKVFNGIRRVLLEKDFGHGLELPKESIMLAAINPEDVGAQDLTSHMKDVVDIIGSQPSWKKTKEYIDGLKLDASTSAVKASKNTIEKMMLSLKDPSSSRNIDLKPFYMSMGDNALYVSPREITSMVSNTASNLDMKLKRIAPLLSGEDSDDKAKAFDIVVDAMFSSIKGTLSTALHKQQVDAPEFLHDLKGWLIKNVDMEGIFFKKASTALTLGNILEPYFKDHSKDLTREIELINFAENNDTQVFKDELLTFLSKHLINDKANIVDKKHPLKKFGKGKLTVDQKELVSKLESMLNDIILSFKVNKVSNEIFDGVKFAMRDAVSVMVKIMNKKGDDDITDEALELNTKIFNLIKI